MLSYKVNNDYLAHWPTSFYNHVDYLTRIYLGRHLFDIRAMIACFCKIQLLAKYICLARKLYCMLLPIILVIGTL